MFLVVFHSKSMKNQWKTKVSDLSRAWKTMKKYAKQDVDLLVKVYKELRPWMNNHPNLNVFTGSSNCPTCGSSNIQYRGYQYTKVATYRQFQCNDCRSYSRTRLAEKVERPEIVP